MAAKPQTQPDTALAIVGKNEYITYLPTVYEWTKGEVRFRLTVPAGQNTDLASIPGGPVSWLARKLGFRKEDPRWHRAVKIHDILCYHIRHNNGILPPGMYQFWNPETRQWEDVITPHWRKKEADQLFHKIMLEDDFPPGRANVAYRMVRIFGRAHMFLS